MLWFLLALAAVAVLAPLIGADTRDSLDWQRGEPFPDEGILRTTGDRAPASEGVLRTTDSRARASSARERVAAHRPTPAAG